MVEVTAEGAQGTGPLREGNPGKGKEVNPRREFQHVRVLPQTARYKLKLWPQTCPLRGSERLSPKRRQGRGRRAAGAGNAGARPYRAQLGGVGSGGCPVVQPGFTDSPPERGPPPPAGGRARKPTAPRTPPSDQIGAYLLRARGPWRARESPGASAAWPGAGPRTGEADPSPRRGWRATDAAISTCPLHGVDGGRVVASLELAAQHPGNELPPCRVRRRSPASVRPRKSTGIEGAEAGACQSLRVRCAGGRESAGCGSAGETGSRRAQGKFWLPPSNRGRGERLETLRALLCPWALPGTPACSDHQLGCHL